MAQATIRGLSIKGIATAVPKVIFDNLRDPEVQLEQVRVVEAPGVTHVKYRSVS